MRCTTRRANQERNMTIDQMLDAKQARRMAAENRFLARMERRENAAEQMIGELSSGKCYVFPQGGKYREGERGDLIAFLIRNQYA
jgi:hypothetical protein